MTDKEKLEKIKKLADAMYYAAFNMTTDASLLRKAMNEYHQFIIYQYFKKEPVSSVWYNARKIVPEFSTNQIICIKEDGLAIATIGRIVTGTIKWAYLNDLLNLSNIQRTVKNWKEPVSEEWIKELRTKLDSMSKEDFKKVFDKYAVDFNEETVSIWHDSNKEQPNYASTVAIWSPKCKNGEIISRCTEVYSDRIWAYIDDLLKM